MDDAVYAWIDDAAALQTCTEAAAASTWLALDSESNSRFVYRERLCLLQINDGTAISLIDSLALPPSEPAWAGLLRSLEDPERTCYLHGGEYDVACLKRDFGIAPRGIFDSQQAASLLGLPRTGYGALLAELHDIDLPKEHGLYDWGRRPIEEEALRYAVDDVRYLPDLADELRARIEAADLVEELAIANQAVEAVQAHSAGFDPADIYRIKGIRSLNKDQLGIIVALHAWRDQRARDGDFAPGRVLNNEVRLKLARQGPTNFGSLRKLRLPGRVLREAGDAIIDTIKAAREQPPDIPEPPHRREIDPSERDRENRLKNWRRAEAERRDVTLAAVLPAKALAHLKQHGASELESVPQLGAKRIRLYPDRLRDVCSDRS